MHLLFLSLDFHLLEATMSLNNSLVNSSVGAPAVPPAGRGVRQPGKMTQFIAHRVQAWGKWTVGLLLGGFLLVVVLGYLAVQWTTYTVLVWQNGQNSAVTLLGDLGHGGMSAVTVTFSDHSLVVVEVDNNDPQRTTVMRVQTTITLGDTSTVIEATLQSVLTPHRLDLVIKLHGGFAYRTQFTTVLINNVEAMKTDPHAPGFREPTADELRQALQKINA
jgi:hypothetical protein